MQQQEAVEITRSPESLREIVHVTEQDMIYKADLLNEEDLFSSQPEVQSNSLNKEHPMVVKKF